MSPRVTLFRQLSDLSRRQKRAVFLAVDMALGSISMFFVVFGDLGSERVPHLAFFALVSTMSFVASAALGLDRIKLNAYGRHAVTATARFSVLVTLGLTVLSQIAPFSMSPFKLLQFGTALFFGCIVSRYAMLFALVSVLRQGQTRCRVLIYGAGDTGQQMAAALRNHSCLLPVAFLDDDVDLQAITVGGLPVLSAARLEMTLRDLAVDRVLLAMPSASPAKLAQIKRTLRMVGIDVQILPSFAQLAGTEAPALPESGAVPTQLLGRRAFTDEISITEGTYLGRVVLVSGAGGSVGSELCRQLIAHRPKTLVLFERSEIALYTVDAELRDLACGFGVRIIPVLGSITDARHVRSTMVETGTEVVFHAAAYKHLPLVEANPVAGLANNVLGTRIFAETAASVGVAQFVLISTDKAVRPSSVMGATKRLAELVVQDLAKRAPNTSFSTVRFGNVLGSSGSVLPIFRDQIARGGPVTLTHEDVTRYFMTLSEAAQLVLVSGAFLQAGAIGTAYVLDMGPPIKIRDLAERMIRAEGLTVKSAEYPAGDIEIIVTGLRQGEKLHEELLIDGLSMPTPHPKILHTHEEGLSEFAMASALNGIRAAVRAGDQLAARTAIATCLEGFPHVMCGRSEPINNDAKRCSA